MALQKALYQIPFSAGLDAKTDVRAKLPPALDIARDVEMDTLKGLVTRKPLAALSMNTIGGGTVSGSLRRVVDNAGELLLFTDTQLYSWVPSQSAWALRDTYMAVAVDELDVFNINNDQTSVDLATMSGVTVMAWVAGSPYIAAIDNATGNVALAPTFLDVTGHGSDAVKLVAMSTKILAIWRDTSLNQIRILAIDPANLAASLVAPTALTGLGVTGVFDAVKVPGADTAIIVVGETSTQYQVFKVTSALGIASATKARGADTAIACSVDPTATFVQVARTASTAATAIVGDRLTLSTLADSAIGQTLGSISGTTVSHITCAYRLVQNGGFYRCYVFCTNDESGVGSASVNTLKMFKSSFTWVDTNGTISSFSDFIPDLGIASQAFAYGNNVYVCGVFAGVPPVYSGNAIALQNTIFLCRDDGLMVAKTCVDRAGGLLTTKCLPSVTLTSGSTVFQYGANVRRRVAVPGGSTYTGRAPCSVTFTFDDNRARRCARIGKTLYITGGQIQQYDGLSLSELGFPVYAWDFTAAPNTGGTIPVGSYTFKVTNKATNAVGEVDRCTTATTATATTLSVGSLVVHLKPLYYGRRTQTANLEVWRTKINPGADDPFYLVTSLDPTVTSGSNCYLTNAFYSSSTQVDFIDALPDSSIALSQDNPENGTVLENLSPPAATIVAASDSRLFLAGIAGLPNTVWYSKTRNDGEVVAFNDSLTFLVPSQGGSMTALAFLENKVVVFRQNAIYAFVGDGFDNSEGGANFQLSNVIATDCGAINADCVANIDVGVMFKSSKGWYLLDRGFNVQYIGGKASGFDGDAVLAMTVLTSQHQVRIATNNRIVVYDFLVGEWFEWTFTNGVHACLSNGVYTTIDSGSNAVKQQRSDWSGITYGMDVETAWIKLADLQGFARVYKYQILGEYESDHHLRFRFAYNYKYASAGVPSYTDDVYWTPYPTTVGSALQVQVSPSIQQIESVKVRITASNPAENGTAPTAGASLALSGIGLEVGLKQGLYKLLAAAQRS